MNKHFDAWGYPTLEHFELIAYYKGDGKSMDVIRKNMPHRLVCEPSVEIVINPARLETIEVVRVWPGGHVSKTCFMNERMLCALRRLYGAHRGLWRVVEKGGMIRFTRRGCAHVASGSKSGWIS
jgi:hypothetical protein